MGVHAQCSPCGSDTYGFFDAGASIAHDFTDWFNSGLVNGLLAGGVLVVAFIIRQFTAEHRAIEPAFLLRGNIPFLILLFIALWMVMLATAYVIPQYLITVQGFRALQIGQVLLLIALPQLLLSPVIGTILRFVDPRHTLATGFALIGIACYMGMGLTSAWASPEFLPSQIVQAVGQSLVMFNLRNSNPSIALKFGAVFQTTRLLGSEIGYALMQTWIRVRQQFHAEMLGGNVVDGSVLAVGQLQDYAAAVAGRSTGTG